MRRHLVLALLVAGARAGSLAAQAVPARFAAVADSLQRLVGSNVVPSISIAVAGPDGIIWEAAFGLADIERMIPARPTTSYPVASVAKSLTAIGAMRAADQGSLDLDRPIADYVGTGWVSVPVGDPRRLTTRALLRMTGGIPHLVHFHWEGGQAGDISSQSARFVAFEPGSQFHYSNLSLGIVAEVLEKISGRSFQDYMMAAVFSPLGLQGSSVRQSALPPELVAQTYSRSREALDLIQLEPAGGAGMFTSAHDLALLARAVFLDSGSTFLSSRGRNSFITSEGFPYYSHGWWRFADDGGRVTLIADGEAHGHAASLKVLPSERIAIAVLTNGNGDGRFTIGLCDLILTAAGVVLNTGGDRGDPPAEFVEHPVTGDTSWMGNWQGVVSTERGPVPLQLLVTATGVSGRVGPGEPAPVTGGAATNGILEGRISGSLPAGLLPGDAPTLGFHLRRQGGKLGGYLNATANRAGRPWLVMPYFVELSR